MMLRDLRESASLTQTEVADFLDTAQAQVSHWELGGATMGDNHVTALSTLFGVSPANVRSAADAARDHWLEHRDLRVGDKIRELRTRDGVTREEFVILDRAATGCRSGARRCWHPRQRLRSTKGPTANPGGP